MTETEQGQTQICECCGEGQASLMLQRTQFPYGVGEQQVMLEADLPIWQCATCGESYTGEGAEEAERRAVCQHLGRLSPDEILEMRKTAGMSQVAFAARLGVGRVTLARWETGQQLQSAVFDRLIRNNAVEEPRPQSRLGRFRTNVDHRRPAAQMFDLVA